MYIILFDSYYELQTLAEFNATKDTYKALNKMTAD